MKKRLYAGAAKIMRNGNSGGSGVAPISIALEEVMKWWEDAIVEFTTAR